MPRTSRLIPAALLPLVYLSTAALLSAGLAYPLFKLTGGEASVRSLVGRGTLVFLVLGLWPLARMLRLDRDRLGLARYPSAFVRQIARGFGLGLLMLGLHTLALLALEVRVVDPSDWKSNAEGLATLAKAFGTGVAIGLIEEFIFRGILFAAVQRIAGTNSAVVVTAFYYAILHFLKSNWKPKGPEVEWDTGFRLLADAIGHLGSLTPDSFLALFLAGLLLGCVRTAYPLGLGYCVGLHAGWVSVIRTAKALTNDVPENRLAFLVGRYDGIIGYLAAAWIAVLVIWFVVGFRQLQSPTAPASRTTKPRECPADSEPP